MSLNIVVCPTSRYRVLARSLAFCHQLSGTGGPLVLVPILIAIKLPVLTAVGLSQVIQIPVAVASTFGNILYGELDFVLAVEYSPASLTVGSWYGAQSWRIFFHARYCVRSWQSFSSLWVFLSCKCRLRLIR